MYLPLHLMMNSYFVSTASSPKSVLTLQGTFIYVPVNICTGILLALGLLNIARRLSKQLPKLGFSNTCMHTHKHTSIHTCTHAHTHMSTYTYTHRLMYYESSGLIYIYILSISYVYWEFTFCPVVLVVRKCQDGKII